MTTMATAPNPTTSTTTTAHETRNGMAPLTEQERWLLRLAHAGILDTSDLAHHPGLSAAQVRGALSSAIDKLGAETLTEAVGAATGPGASHRPSFRPRRGP